MAEKKYSQQRARSIGDGINKKIIDKGRMLNTRRNAQAKAKAKSPKKVYA